MPGSTPAFRMRKLYSVSRRWLQMNSLSPWSVSPTPRLAEPNSLDFARTLFDAAERETEFF